MLKNRFSRLLILLLALAVAVGVYVGPAALADEGTPISILHMNDVHGRVDPIQPDPKGPFVGGLARAARLVFDLRAERPGQVLLLSAGDMIHGTNVANMFQGRPVIECMNLMYFDAMTLGNHEFNFGQQVLSDLSGRSLFPFLGANVGNAKAFAKPYVVKEVNGLKVAVIGLSAQETPIVTHPKNVEGLTFDDPIAAAKKAVSQVGNVDLIVALTHIGADLDVKLAQEVPQIDVIVGGHSHTQLDQPKKVGDTIIVQDGEYGKFLGRLDVKVAGGKVVSYEGKLVPVANELIPVTGIDAVISAANSSLNSVLGTVIGETKVALDGERANVRTRETNLGNFIADVMRNAVGADVAIANGGGIRASLPAGPMKVGDVFTIVPFDNTVVLLEATGAQILKALENGLGKYPEQLGAFCQISGMTVLFDPAKPAGSRVVEVKVAGAPLDPAKLYKVATNDFMAAGGDGYTSLKEARLISNTGEMLRDAVVKVLRTAGSIEPKVEGRITTK